MVRIGLAGLGRFGKLHAEVFAQLPGADLVAICDVDRATVDAVGDRLGIAASGRFTDYGGLLAMGLDAVVIVTPEPLHAEMALAAIARDIHVLCEKPLATTSAEGTRVVAAARDAGVELQVGFLLRFDIQHATLKDHIGSGTFGDLVSLRFKRNVSRAWFPAYGDFAHPVFETTIHDLDLLIWYVDSPCTSVYAVSRSTSGHRFPDACFALLTFANGAVGYVETVWLLPEGAPANVLAGDWRGTIDAEIEVVGTNRAAKLSALNSGLEIWGTDGILRPESALWPTLHGRMAGALREEDAHFTRRVVARLAGTPLGPDAVCSVESAVTGLRLAEAIVLSAERGVAIDPATLA